MQSQRRRDTGPELALRSSLHRAGFRFRVDYRLSGLRRSADLAFPRERVAVFMDGCFWHGCPEHRTSPKANAAWWQTKIEANIARDRDTDARLEQDGWAVIRIWEHEPLDDSVARIAAEVSARRAIASGDARENELRTLGDTLQV